MTEEEIAGLIGTWLEDRDDIASASATEAEVFVTTQGVKKFIVEVREAGA